VTAAAIELPTCGDYGGKTLKKEKCTHEPGWGTDHEGQGRCKEHDFATEATLQALKKKFLEYFGTGEVALVAAAKKVGVGPSQIWRYRQADPTFDQQVKAIQHASDSIRLALVEDSLFSRVVASTASPAEVIFFLVNRGGGRWRHVQRIEHVGDPDHPVQVKHRNADLDDMTTEQKIERLHALVAAHIGPDGVQRNGPRNGKRRKSV
jgi:hypothetical protein